MKILWSFLKPILLIIGALWSGFMAFDLYDTSKIVAHTEPIKREIKQYNEWNRQSLERLERESIMIRSQQEETNNLLIQYFKRK